MREHEGVTHQPAPVVCIPNIISRIFASVFATFSPALLFNLSAVVRCVFQNAKITIKLITKQIIPEVGLNSLGTLSLGVGTPKYILIHSKSYIKIKNIFTSAHITSFTNIRVL